MDIEVLPGGCINSAGWMAQGLSSDKEKRSVSFPKHPDLIWGPPFSYSVGILVLLWG